MIGATVRFIDWKPVAMTMRSAVSSEPSVSSTECSLTRRISIPLFTAMLPFATRSEAPTSM